MSSETDASSVDAIIRKKKMGQEVPKAVATAMAITGKDDKPGNSLLDVVKLTEGSTGNVVIIDCRDQSVINIVNNEKRSLASRLVGWFNRNVLQTSNPNLLPK